MTKSGMTPLHMAAENGRLEFVTWLTDQGVDIEILDNEGKTAAALAKGKGFVDIAKLIRPKGTRCSIA